MTAPLLEIRNLSIVFDTAEGPLHAVNNLSYSLMPGETLGIVGESGSGKSVHIMALLGLLPSPPARVVSGEILFDGENLLKLTEKELRNIRGGKIGMIFQNPMSSLNPVLTIGRQILEVILRHTSMSRKQATAHTIELLDLVGISAPASRLTQYPHEFSGGMRQRVMIAIGLACNPKLLIADEATTALDVTIQAQIIDLIQNLKEKSGITIIWITHDISSVSTLADTLQVMYAGRVVERGPFSTVINDPRSAYTWGLLRSIPSPSMHSGQRIYQIPGSPPNMLSPPQGDPFAPRNPFATPRCHRDTPPLRQVPNSLPGHMAAAWYDLPALLSLHPEASDV